MTQSVLFELECLLNCGKNCVNSVSAKIATACTLCFICYFFGTKGNSSVPRTKKADLNPLLFFSRLEHTLKRRDNWRWRMYITPTQFEWRTIWAFAKRSVPCHTVRNWPNKKPFMYNAYSCRAKCSLLYYKCTFRPILNDHFLPQQQIWNLTFDL